MTNSTSSKIRKLAVKSFYFRTYLIFNLPMGFLSGMKIKKARRTPMRGNYSPLSG